MICLCSWLTGDQPIRYVGTAVNQLKLFSFNRRSNNDKWHTIASTVFLFVDTTHVQVADVVGPYLILSVQILIFLLVFTKLKPVCLAAALVTYVPLGGWLTKLSQVFRLTPQA